MKRASTLIAGIWLLNALALLGVAALMAFAWNGSPPATIASPTASRPSPPTPTPWPTIYYLPTHTPNPRATPIEVPTWTPFVLPDGKRPVVIGYSVSGRPLEVYLFGNGEVEKMIVAGIHGGNEWNTIALADELILYLNEHPETVPPDVTLYILRNLNPDGEARAHNVDGRVNDHGVDLNRNWPYRWKAEWDRDGCWDYRPVTAGAYPASEPETVALMNFLTVHRIQALISYHSAALGIFAGGVPDYPPSIRLAKALAAVSSYRYPPIDTGCDYTGNLTDWASSVRGIPAVDIELTNHRDTDFEMNLRILRAFLEWK